MEEKLEIVEQEMTKNTLKTNTVLNQEETSTLQPVSTNKIFQIQPKIKNTSKIKPRKIIAEDVSFKIKEDTELEKLDTNAKIKLNTSLLDMPIKEFIKNSKYLHAANIARNINQMGITNFDQKAYFTYITIASQNLLKIYPYDRYLKDGSNFNSIVKTPNTEQEKKCIIWCTNLYLGLNRHPDILRAVKKSVSKYGVGCGTSAVSGGFSSLHKKLEKKLANHLNKEDAVLFPTGFTTNLGGISAIATSRDLILGLLKKNI